MSIRSVSTCAPLVAASLPPFVVPSIPPLVVDSLLFVALVWGTLLFVLVVYLFILHGVVRAGGIDLSVADGPE